LCIVRAAECLAGSLLPENSGSNTATSPNGILETAKSKWFMNGKKEKGSEKGKQAEAYAVHA
jgi:hypothetical protein